MAYDYIFASKAASMMKDVMKPYTFSIKEVGYVLNDMLDKNSIKILPSGGKAYNRYAVEQLIYDSKKRQTILKKLHKIVDDECEELAAGFRKMYTPSRYVLSDREEYVPEPTEMEKASDELLRNDDVYYE